MSSPSCIGNRSGHLPWILLFLTLPGVSTTWAGGPEFYKSFNGAIAAAEKKSKPVILIFPASWCPPCQQMKHTLYPAKEIEPYHNSSIWTCLDVGLPESQGGAPPSGFREIVVQVLPPTKTVAPKTKAAQETEEAAPKKEETNGADSPFTESARSPV